MNLNMCEHWIFQNSRLPPLQFPPSRKSLCRSWWTWDSAVENPSRRSRAMEAVFSADPGDWDRSDHEGLLDICSFAFRWNESSMEFPDM